MSAKKYEEGQLQPIFNELSRNPGDTVVSVQFDVYNFAADNGVVDYETHRFSLTEHTFRKIANIIVEDAQ